jgi:capsular polysaccharide transport system permease protein
MSAMSSSNPQESFIVADFLKSRQAVEDLEAAINIRQLYSRPEVDWWARFNGSLPLEAFSKYWRRMIDASYDPVTGIATAEVRAFTAKDAYLIASTLVRLSEELINTISNRPQRDAVRFAEGDVKRAEERLQSIRAELTRYRNSEQLIDPQSNVVTSNVVLAQSLRAMLSQLQTEQTALEKEKGLSRNAPALVSIGKRIAATKEQLAAIEGQISNLRDGANPLSKVVAEYERLDLERQFAQNMVLSTMQKLEEARASLIAQHVYVTPYVQPALPQSSTYPKRFLSIAVVGLLCFIFWVVGLLVVRSVREHLN